MLRHPIRIAVVLVAALAAAGTAATMLPETKAGPQVAAKKPASKRGTGLPLPRFVSLKSSKIHVRQGPGSEYDIVFTFMRAGMPVEIVQEFGNWRKIRDSDGQEGWVFHSLLSGRRTAVVATWASTGEIAARRAAYPGSAVTAYLEPRVLTDVEECAAGWCLVHGTNYSGWMEQEKLWGVYPDEEVSG